MKCLINDYAGHPFQVHLSRHLAQRGHEVHHVYCADNPGPKGSFQQLPGETLRFVGITLGQKKGHAAGTGAVSIARRFYDVAYGRDVARIVREVKPDVVLSGNTPTEAQQSILKTCKAENIRFVYWVQDIYSLAVSKLLTKKLGYAGKAIGWYYQLLDRRQFRASDAILAISADFVRQISAWTPIKPTVIENWAALDDLPVGPKNNAWSRGHALHANFVFLYSGTLGRKHNPNLLIRLAKACGTNETVVVVAQGFGVPQLQAAETGHLKLLPLQPARHLAEVLATADVLTATIEPDAGVFAVPSKVLSYLCAGRPILLAAPKENLAAHIVGRANAGIVVDPHDPEEFMRAAYRLRDDAKLRAELGANGRAYAERTFDMRRITDSFERVLDGKWRP